MAANEEDEQKIQRFPSQFPSVAINCPKTTTTGRGLH
jgi:hypothetical protein